MTTNNYKKHTSTNLIQKFLIDRFFDALLIEVQALKPIRILDAGCGEGFTLEKMRRLNIGQVLEGVDAQVSAIELGKATHPGLTLREGSIYSLPYQDDSFDVVVCTEVLEHLECPEDALRELYRVSSHYCVITVPHEPFFQIANLIRGKNISRFGNDIEHIQHWSTQGIVKLINSLFTVQKVRTPFPWSLIVAEK